jgi:sporulation protein YlmC with PRC-barrel domain
MNIPINAEVQCTDGACGRSTYVVLDPHTGDLTHLVVEEKHMPHTERLVAIDQVLEANPRLIRLRCSRQELAHMERFAETRLSESHVPQYEGARFAVWPVVLPKTQAAPATEFHVPSREVALHRGARVKATDGYVGQVDEFVVDPIGEQITHVVVRVGHGWGRKDVSIPISQVERVEGDRMYLKVDKHSVEVLAAVPA